LLRTPPNSATYHISGTPNVKLGRDFAHADLSDLSRITCKVGRTSQQRFPEPTPRACQLRMEQSKPCGHLRPAPAQLGAQGLEDILRTLGSLKA